MNKKIRFFHGEENSVWNKCGAVHEARLRQASADAYLFHVGNTGDSLSKNLLPPGILQILPGNRENG